MRKTRTNITFSVDNVNMGQYFLKGSKANTLLYNITAFEASNLSNTTHVLDIVGGKGSDAMYLDYIQYTQLPPNATSTSITSSTSTSAHTSSSTATSAQNNSPPHRLSTAGIAAIGVAGGVAALLLGNLAIWAQRRKRKATKRPRSSDDALLRFHQDVFMPRARTDEARFTQTHPNQSSVAFAQYIQAPQTSVTRGVR
ncbi:hypothetical protein FRB90_001964 [Tulasnella sp. 427]|nr:hypothetical protein FRB90_001964 [Tulasnella sp. 427]